VVQKSISDPVAGRPIAMLALAVIVTLTGWSADSSDLGIDIPMAG
jgi:hypothetical protein